MFLVQPPSMSFDEMFNTVITEEENIKVAMTQGGEIVDRELAHQMMEMFELSRLHKVQIDEDIDISAWADSVNL